MEANAKTRVQQTIRWLLSAATVLVAMLLIVQCLGIYHEGISPENMGENGLPIHEIYSREIVAARFQAMAWSVWLWLALLVAAIVAGRPKYKETLRAPLENQLMLLRARTEDTEETRRVQRKRVALWCVTGILCLGCAVMMSRFLLDWRNFASRDLEPVIRQMAIAVFPWMGVGFAVLIAAEEINARLLKAEAALRKTAPKRKPTAAAEKKPLGQNVVRVVLAAAAVTLIVLGVLNGGMFDVLVKAINICTECIGLG